MRFLDFLFPPRTDELVVREQSPDSFLGYIRPESVALEGGTAVTLLPFHEPRVRATIHEAKYHGNEKAFTLLAAALAEYLKDADADLSRARLVPVPLGEKRLKERGFNQAEEITRRVAKELGLALETELLVRTRETVSQISLPRREREENMRGAFACAKSPTPAYLYIVVDDVLTTGATLSAACAALKSGGASNILAIALAH